MNRGYFYGVMSGDDFNHVKHGMTRVPYDEVEDYLRKRYQMSLAPVKIWKVVPTSNAPLAERNAFHILTKYRKTARNETFGYGSREEAEKVIEKVIRFIRQVDKEAGIAIAPKALKVEEMEHVREERREMERREKEAARKEMKEREECEKKERYELKRQARQEVENEEARQKAREKDGEQQKIKEKMKRFIERYREGEEAEVKTREFYNDFRKWLGESMRDQEINKMMGEIGIKTKRSRNVVPRSMIFLNIGAISRGWDKNEETM